jgi:hypothetical protein
MAATWEHPNLGTFTYQGTAWERTVSVPAFKAFSYDTGYPNAPRSEGWHTLAFAADGKKDLPTPAAVALAERVLANQAALVDKVKAAMWDDFTGRGPGSGMWWNGDLDQVAGMMSRQDPPASADDVLRLMQLAAIWVCKNEHGDGELVVELAFHAAFEDEHGVGVLTDGENILGIGYMTDAAPFDDAE